MFSSSPDGLISILTSWPRDFFRLLTSSPYSFDGDSGMSSSSSSFAPGSHGDYSNSILHFGEREYVVMGFWKMGSGLGLAASMLVVALVAVLHEAVLGLRFFLEREQTLLNAPAQKASLAAAIEEGRGMATTSSGYVNEQAGMAKPVVARGEVRGELREIFRRTFTRARMLQALLYFVQWLLFLFVFVLVPCGTFNVPLILAALLGKTAGYLLFIGSPAMESVERIPPSPSAGGSDGGPIQLTATRKNLRSF